MIDIGGLGAGALTQPLLKEMLSAAIGMMQEHYIERNARVLIVNAPAWFAWSWRAIAPLINESSHAKIAIILASDSDAIVRALGGEPVRAALPPEV